MSPSGWTCQRVTGGVKCGFKNPPRIRKCRSCGKPKPPKRQPAHRAALQNDYEHFIQLTGAERCGICGRGPSTRRKLDRDHCHSTGTPRGLLCARCNRALPNWVTPSWLRSAADYLERTAT